MKHLTGFLFFIVFLAACTAAPPPPATLPATFTPLPTRTPRPTFTVSPIPSQTPTTSPTPTPAISPTPSALPVIEAAHWGTSNMASIAWSPDGKYLAADSGDSLYLFDTSTWQLVDQQILISSVRPRLEFSPNSLQLMVTDHDLGLVIFDLAGGKLRFSWGQEQGEYPNWIVNPTDAQQLFFSADSSLLINQQGGYIWRVSDGSLVYRAEKAIFSPDGRWVLEDRTITRVSDQRSLYRLDRYYERNWFSPDGELLAGYYYSNGRQLSILRASDGSLLQSWAVGLNSISKLHFLADNTLLLLDDGVRNIQVWRIADQALLLDLQEVLTLLSPDGTTLAAWKTNEPAIQVYSVASGRRLLTVQLESSRVSEVAFSPDGSLLVAAGDKIAQVWNAANGSLVCTLEGEADSHDYDWLAFAPTLPDSSQPPRLAGINGYRLKIWNASDGKVLETLSQEPRRITQLAFSADDQRLAFMADWNVLGLIPLDTATSSLAYEPFITIDHSQDDWRTHRFSLPVISPQGDVVLYHGRSDWEVSTLTDGSLVTSVASYSWSSGTTLGFSSDGRLGFFQSSENGGEYVIFNVSNGQIVRRLPGPIEELYKLDHELLSAGGKYLVGVDNSSNNPIIYVQDTASGRLLYRNNDFSDYLNYTLSANGEILAVNQYDQPLHLFSLKDGKRLQVLGEPTSRGEIAISDDGQSLAHAVRGVIRIFRLADGKLVAELPCNASLTSLVFSHNGRYLASGTDKGLIQLWDLRPPASALPTATPTLPPPTLTPTPMPEPTAAPIAAPPAFSGTPFPQPQAVISVANASRLRLMGQMGFGAPRAAAWSPDGKQLVVSSGSGLRFYAANPWRQVEWLEVGKQVADIVISPDGSTLLMAVGTEIHRYLLSEQRWLAPLSAGSEFYTSLTNIALSQDGKFIAGVNEGQVAVWDIAKETLVSSSDGCANCDVLGISADGSLVAAYSPYYGRLKFTKVQDGSLLADLQAPVGKYGAYAFSEDLSYLGLRAEDGSADIYRLKPDAQPGSQMVLVQNLPEKQLSTLAFSADNQFVFTGNLNEGLSMWQLASGEKVRELEVSDQSSYHSVSFSKLYISPSSDQLFAVSSTNMHLVWDLSGKDYQPLQGFHGGAGINNLAFSADGSEVWLGQHDGLIAYARRDGSLVKIIPGDSETMQILSDGSLVAMDTHSEDQHPYIELLRVQGDRLKRVWDMAIGSHTDSLVMVATSSDGRYLAAASFKGRVHLVRGSDGTTLDEAILYEKDCYPWSLVFSPDGALLAASCYNASALWRIQDDKLLSLDIYLEGDSEFAFSPDGKKMAISHRTDIRFISLPDGSPISLITETGYISALAFSPDGSLLASGSNLGVIEVWEVVSGTKLITLSGMGAQVLELEFSPDGKTLAGLSRAGTLRVWGIFGDE